MKIRKDGVLEAMNRHVMDDQPTNTLTRNMRLLNCARCRRRAALGFPPLHRPDPVIEDWLPGRSAVSGWPHVNWHIL